MKQPKKKTLELVPGAIERKTNLGKKYKPAIKKPEDVKAMPFDEMHA